MPEYSEIPGVYSEQPRPFTTLRRWLRTYRTALIAFLMLVFVISLASGISIIISQAIIQDPPSQPSQPAANQSLQVLLALPWPRRDDHWYTSRWDPTMTPAAPEAPPPPDPDAAPWTDPDGSTFPQGDTWHWNRRPDSLPPSGDEDVSEALAMGSRAEEERSSLEKSMQSRNITLRPNTADYRHQHGFRKTFPLAQNMSRLGYAMNHATLGIKERLKLPRSTTTFDARWLSDLLSSPHCDPALLRPHPAPCDPKERYRRVDGSCNNLENPTWGASFTPFRRMLPSDYGDGVWTPRQGTAQNKLPGARKVSLGVHGGKRVSSQSYTVLTMSWGQFVDHDITLTALSKGANGDSIACCTKEVLRNRTLQHPECFPIPIPDADPLYKGSNTTCLEFTRSAPAPECRFGPREQINQQTAYLDASGVYGATPEVLAGLRAMKNGLLKSQVTLDGRELLPASTDPLDGCNKQEEFKYDRFCFVAGDPRVNEQLLLTSLHTVLARQHNTLALGLKSLNPAWEDEQVFQEARRILIAQVQHITFHEYVPSILGPRFMSHLGLSPNKDGHHAGGYEARLSPAIANEFAAAAFRFGHSQIQGLVQQIDGPGKNINFAQLSSITFNPFSLYNQGVMANYLRGETSQKAAAVDTYFSPQVTGRLFGGSGGSKAGHGIDLVAINIQRGRDHGVPAYTRMRMACGLPRVQNFSDLAWDMDEGALSRIRTVYGHVDDIDLYTGGLAERPVEGGLVGPTFACVLADQFLRLKRGDRFWYETRQQPQAFTREQLAEIHRTSLARILCDNVPELASVQRWPLRVFATGNPRLPCSSLSIPSLDLDPWEEDPGL